MFRTIVVGYDGRRMGGDAIALAEVLRDPREGTLVLTSVLPEIPPAAGGYPVPETLDALRREADRELAVARDALPDPARGRVRTVSSASPSQALTEVAAEEHADLVVIGSTRRGALGRVLPGTTGDRLGHGAACAVAVAPLGYERRAMHRLGVAYDGSPESEAAVRVAETLALELCAALTVYCVLEPSAWTASVVAQQHARKLLRRVVDDAPEGLALETLLLHGLPVEEISRRVHDDRADLLLVGSRGYGPLRRALVGTVSGGLARAAGCPVIVTPRNALAGRGVPPRHDRALAG